jgi:hypothetical protein
VHQQHKNLPTCCRWLPAATLHTWNVHNFFGDFLFGGYLEGQNPIGWPHTIPAATLHTWNEHSPDLNRLLPPPLLLLLLLLLGQRA